MERLRQRCRILGIFLFAVMLSVFPLNIRAAVQWTVTYDTNGGNAIEAVVVDVDDDVSEAQVMLPTPTTADADAVFKCWTSLADAVEYAADTTVTITDDTTFTAHWQYAVSYAAGADDGTVSELPQESYVESGMDIVLPAAPTRSGYSFTGWKPEGTEQLLQAGESYTVNGKTVFTAQWSEWPRITSYAALSNFTVNSNLHYAAWSDLVKVLKENASLNKLTYTTNAAADNTGTLIITDWQLIDANGNVVNNPSDIYQGKAQTYKLRPVYTLPEKLQECDKLPELIVDIRKDQTSGEIVDTAAGEFVFEGSDKDDIITVTYENGYLVITFEDGSDMPDGVRVKTVYKLQNKTRVEIRGGAGNDIIKLNAANLAGLTSFVVEGGAGADTITTSAAANSTLNWTNADVALNAETMNFQVSGLKIIAKSLKICPSITAGTDPTSGCVISLNFNGVTVQTTGEFIVKAQVIDDNSDTGKSQGPGSTVTTPSGSTVKLPNDTKLSIKEAIVEIKLDNATISASSIDITGQSKLTSQVIGSTQAIVQGMNARTLISISQNTVLNSSGLLNLKAEAIVSVTSGGSVISVVSVNSEAVVELKNATLKGKTGIQVQAENKVNITNTSAGGDSGGTSPPGTIAATGVTQNTKAGATDCTFNKGVTASKVLIKGTQICTTKTTTTTSITNKQYSATVNTMDALLSFLEGLGYADNTKVLDAKMAGALRTKYTNALLGAAKDAVFGSSTALDKTKAQQVGAFAVSLVNGSNAAFIKGGSVNAADLSILAAWNNSNEVLADASGVTVEVTKNYCGIGAAAAILLNTYQNQAYLEGTLVEAASNILIAAGAAADSGAVNSKVTAKAGLSTGNNSDTMGLSGSFGIAGAIALNFYKNTVNAWMKNISQNVTVGKLMVSAEETSNQETLADGVPNHTTNAQGKKPDKYSGDKLVAGNGAAIAYNVFDNRIQAGIIDCASVKAAAAVSVKADSSGVNKAYAYCGSGKQQGASKTPATGSTLVSSLGMNVLYQEVKALLQGGSLSAAGKVSVNAGSTRTVDILADSQAADADVGYAQVVQGNPTGVDSVALGLNIAKLVTEANLNSSVTKAAGVDVIASGSYTETVRAVAGLTAQSMMESAGLVVGLYDLMDNLYKAAQIVSGLTEQQGVLGKAPVHAKTYEFFLNIAAVDAQSNTTLETKAVIGKPNGTEITLANCGDVNVTAVQKGTFTVCGDGSTAADATIGSAAALGNYSMTNYAGVENNAIINTPGSKVNVNASNGGTTLSFNIYAGSGTSRSNTTGTTVVVLEKLFMNYKAYVNGEVTASNIAVKAEAKESSKIIAGSEKDFVNLLLKNEATGMGAAFSYLDFNGAVKAEINGALNAQGTGDALSVMADYNGTHTIKAQSGNQSNYIDKAWTAGQNALDASLALNIFILNAEALVNNGASVTSNGNIIISASTKTKNVVSANASQKGGKKAAGASAAISLVKVGTHAKMSGRARAPQGTLSVKAEAASADDVSAYASSSGVDVKNFMKGNGKKWLASIVKGDFGAMDVVDGITDEDTGIAGTINSGFQNILGFGVSPFQPLSNIMLIKNTINGYKQTTGSDGKQKVEKDDKSKMVFAAAFGMNQLTYDTSAVIDGIVEAAKIVEVTATNHNNFATYATAFATSADKSISAACALLINKSKANASAKTLGSSSSPIASVSIIAKTTNNMGEGGFTEYRDKIAAQALAGSTTSQSGQDKDGNAKEGITATDLEGTGLTQDNINQSSTLGFAGGVAVIISSVQTNAYLAEGSNVYTNGKLLIQASEQAKIAARGWGGDYSSKSEGATEPKGAGAGVGLALIIADNKIHSYIGNNSAVTAGSVYILAERIKVTQQDYKFSWDLTFDLNFTDTNGNLKPSVQTNVSVENLIKQFTDALNYFATCNFYAGAIGGAFANGGSLVGAGSFAVLVLNNSVTANIGDNVKLTLLNHGNVDIKALSDLFVITVTGTITMSGKAGIGASAGTNNTTDVVEASIGNGTTVTNPGSVSVTADTQYMYIGVAAAGTKADKFGVAGVLILLNGGNTTKAQIGDNFTLTGGAGNLTVSAANRMIFWGVPVGVQYSGGGASVGAAVLVLNMKENVLAVIGNVKNISIDKDVIVTARNEENLHSIVAGGGYAEKAEVTLNSSVKNLNSNITASIGKGNITANDVLVRAEGIVKTFAASAGVSASQKGAVGGVNDTNVFNQKILAYINGANLNLNGNLTVEAISSEDIQSYVVGLAAGGNLAADGSLSVQKVENTVKAYLGNGTIVTKAGNVTVQAKDTVTMWILAGDAGGSKSVAVGIANADVLMNNTIHSYIGSNANVKATGNILILAVENEKLQVFVVGGGAAGKTAVNGSVSVIEITDNVQASVESGAVVNAGGNVQLKAEKIQDISALVGVISGAGKAAIGASSNTVKINGTTKSYIADNAKITANGIKSGAYADTTLRNLVVGGSGAGTAAAGASVNVIVFGSRTESIVGKAVLNSTGDIIVEASDKVKMHDIVGSVQGAGSAAIGAAVDVITMGRTVRAILGNGSNVSADGSIFVNALAEQTMHVYAVGAAGSGSAAVNGNTSVIVSKNNVFAGIGDDSGSSTNHAIAFANGNIVIQASMDSKISVYAIGAAGSGSAAVSVGVSTIVLTDKTTAQTGQWADVTALGNAAAVNFYDGSKGKGKKNQYGLMIGAYNNTQISQRVCTVSGSGAAAVSPASATVVSKAVTTAKIGNYGQINQTSRENKTPSANQGVRVVAVSESDCEAIGGGGAGSTVGVGAAVIVIVQNKNTTAQVGAGANIQAKANVDILASSYNTLELYAAAIGGGVVGVSGSVDVVVLQDNTTAQVANGSTTAKTTINAGSIMVSAVSEQKLDLNAGSASGGIASVGAGTVVLNFQGSTKALLGNSADAAYVQLTTTTGALVLSAVSKETAKVCVIGAGGGAAQVSGSVIVLIMNVTTQALVGNNVMLQCGGKMSITAQDTAKVTGLSGTGGGGAAQVGGAVVVILFRNTISAGIQGGTITAGSIAILAKAERTVEAKAFAGGGGVASVNGSVVVISVGASTNDSDTNKALNNTVKDAQSDVSKGLENMQANSTLPGGTYGECYDSSDVTGVYEGISVNLNDFFNGSKLDDKVTAFIAGGTVTTTTGGISVNAQDSTTVSAMAGSAGGGVAAIGGAVVIVTLKGSTEAYSAGELSSKGNLDILAGSTLKLQDMLTVSGAGGAVGLGGSVVILNITGVTSAHLGGTVNQAGAVNVKATGTITVPKIQTYAGALGAVGIGAAYVKVNLSGKVTSYLGQGLHIVNAGAVSAVSVLDITGMVTNGNVTLAGTVAGGASVVKVTVNMQVDAYGDRITIDKAASLAIKAENYLTLTVNNVGLSGAISGALSGIDVTVNVQGDVKAYLQAGSNVNVTDAVEIAAKFQVKGLNITAKGAAVAGGASGNLTKITLTVNPKLSAYVDSSKITAGGKVSIYALYNMDNVPNTSQMDNRPGFGPVTYNVSGAAGSAAGGASGSGLIITVNLKGSIDVHVNASTITAGDLSVLASGIQNLTVNGGTGAYALGISAGGASSTVSDTMFVTAYVQDSELSGNNGAIFAIYSGRIKVDVKGSAMGLLANGTAQSSTITSTVSVNSYLRGGKVTMKGDFLLVSGRTLEITANVKGHAASGFASGGLTNSKIIVNIADSTLTDPDNSGKKMQGVFAMLDGNAVINAGGKVTIGALDKISVDNSGYASTGALGGSANGVTVENTINLKTSVEMKQNCRIDAGSIELTAKNEKYYGAYASSFAGAIAALGVAKAVQTVNDEVAVLVRSGNYLKAVKDIILTAKTDYIKFNNKTTFCEAKGGKGGLATGTNVSATMNQTIKSHIETYTKGTTATVFESESGDVQMHALSNLIGSVKSSIALGWDAVSKMVSQADTANTVTSFIDFGQYTQIKGVNVVLRAEVQKVDVSADTQAETVSALNTHLEPTAVMNNTITATVQLRDYDSVSASQELWIAALVSDVKATTYSKGDTKGVTGSVLSKSTNNTTVKGNVYVDGNNTELRGCDVLIDASAANTYRQKKAGYSNKAEYKAYTVTEFVKKTVTRVVEVVEKVTEKICKWLPWPFNKIIKWIVKTVVKLVEIVEEILVEHILDSKTESKTEGKFNSSEGIRLNGHIYYGSNADVDIVVNESGNIDDEGVVWNKVGSDTIYIQSFKSKSAGRLNISAEYGTVSGSVTVHSNDMIPVLNITNNSNYHLKLGDFALSSNADPEACNYQVYAKTNNLEMNDVTDIGTAPRITINSTNGKNVIFAGTIQDYAATFTMNMNNGSVYQESGKLGANQFTVNDAADIGTSANRFQVNLYISDNYYPIISLTGTGSVFAGVTLMQYVDNRFSASPLPTELNSGSNFLTVKAGGTADILLNEAKLLVAQDAKNTQETQYTYEKKVETAVKITDELEVYYNYGRQEIPGLEVRYITDDSGETIAVEYWVGETQYYIPDGYSLMYEESGDNLTYYIISNEPEMYYVYKGTTTPYPLEANQDIRWSSEDNCYYLITTTTVTVTETLETEYQDGVALVETPISSNYHLGNVSGSQVTLTADAKGKQMKLYLDNPISGTGNVNVQGTDYTTVYINNMISSANGNVSVSTGANQRVIFNAAGQLHAVNGTASVTTGTLITEKAKSSTKPDIVGRHIILNVTDGGTAANPILVETGADGISAQCANNLYLYSAKQLVLDNLTASNLVNIQSKGDVVLKDGHTGVGITANELVLNTEAGIGTAQTPVTVSIGTAGMTVTAVNGIYLTQKKQAGYLNEIHSQNGDVQIRNDAAGTAGNLYLGNISANGLADIEAVNGSLLQNVDGASVTAQSIILKAGTDIGSSVKNLIIALGTGALTAQAGGDLYIQDLDGNVRLDSVSAGKKLYLNVAGDILNGNSSAVNVSGNSVTLISQNGNVGAADNLLKVQSVSGLKVQAAKGIYLYHPGNASHVNLSGNENITFKADGTILLDSIRTGNQAGTKAVIISVNGDILDCAEHGEAAVTAPNITLEAANGRIGASDASGFMVIELGDNGSLNANAKGNIALKDNAGVVRAERVTSTEGSISLETAGNLELGVLSAANGQITLNTLASVLNGNPGTETNLTAKKLAVNAAGTIGTSGKRVRTNVASMTVHAGGDIYLEDVQGAVTVTEMISTNGNIDVITAGTADIIKAEALNGNLTFDVKGSANLGELKGNAAGGTISIKAAQNIVNRGAADLLNLLADVIILQAGGTIGTGASPVRTDGNILEAQAERDIWMTDVNGAVTVRGLKSKTGGIILITNGDTRITSLEADKEVQVTAQSGNIVLGSLITNQKAAVAAAAGSIFGDGTQTNIQASDITLTADVNGAGTIGTEACHLILNLGSGSLNAKAGKSIYLDEVAGDIRIEDLTSKNGDIILKAVGNIAVNTVKAAKGIVSIITQGALSNAKADNGTNLTGQEINLTVKQAGTSAKPITVSTGKGSLNLQSQNTIWLTGQDTILNLGKITVAKGDVYLKFLKDCVNGLLAGTDVRNITADNLYITANGRSVGTQAKAVTTDLAANGILNVIGADNFYLSEKDKLYVTHLDALHTVLLTAENGDAYTEEIIGTDITICAGGQIQGAGVHDKYVTGKNLTLKAGRGIGTAAQYYRIDTTGAVSADAKENIYIWEVSGDLYTKQIASEADVYLEAEGGIFSGSSTLTNVSGKNLYLKAKRGQLGTQEADLTLHQLAGGSLTASTVNQEMHMKAAEGDLNLMEILAGDADISLKAKGSILNGRADEAWAVQAKDLYLETEKGTIGTQSKALYIELSDLGRLDVNAGGSVYLEEKTDSVKLGIIKVNGEDFVLTVLQDIFTALTLEEMQAGIANLTAKNMTLIAKNGQIGQDSNAGQNYLEEDYLGWITTCCTEGYEVNASAVGDIYIRELTGSMKVGTIVSENGSVSASAQDDLYGDVVRGNNIYVETTTGEISVSVDAVGDVIMNACGSITNMNPDCVDGVDSIEIKGNNVTLISRDGNIGTADSYIEIDVGANGALNAVAKGDVYIRENDSDLNIGTIESQTGNVGLDAVNGNILAVLEQDGFDICGKDILLTASGNVGNKERPIVLKSDGTVSVIAGMDVVLSEISGDLVIDTIKTQGDVVLSADRSILLDSERDASVPSITGKNMNLTAQNGSLGTGETPISVEILDGGSLTGAAKDGVYLEAPNGSLNLDSLTAGKEIILTAKDSILNGAENGLNLKASYMELTAQEGTIGSADKALVTNGGTILAKAQESIWMESLKDLYVQTIESVNGDITLTGKASIYNGLRAEGTNLIGENITVQAAGNVGAKDKYLVTELGENGVLNAQAQKDIYIREANGNLNLGKVESKGGNVGLDAVNGNILAVLSQNGFDIYGKDILLNAPKGTIGTKERPVILDSTGKTALYAKGDIVLTELSGNLVLDTVKSDADVILNADGSILLDSRRDAGVPAVTGRNMELTSQKGSLGTRENPLSLAILAGGSLTGSAKTSAYLDVVNGNLNLNRITAQKEIVLTAKGSILNAAAGGSNLEAPHVELTAKGGTIGSADKAIVMQGGSILADAVGDIYLESLKDLFVQTVESAKGNITLTGKAGIYNGLTAAGSNLTGNNIMIQSAANVGTPDKYLVINLGTKGVLNVQAQKDICIREANGNLNLGKVESKGGNVRLDAVNGNILAVLSQKGWDVYGKDIVLSASKGTIGMKSRPVIVESNGSTTLSAKGDIVLKELSGDLVLNTVKSGTNVILSAPGSILNGSSQGINLDAAYMELTAKGGTIGSADKALVVNGGKLLANADGGIWLESRRDLSVQTMKSTDGDIVLTGRGNIYNGLNSDEANLAGKNISIRSDASVGTKDRYLVTDLTGNQGSLKVNAKADIYLTEKSGDLTADELNAGRDIGLGRVQGDVKVNHLEAAGNVVIEDIRGNVALTDAAVSGTIAMKKVAGNVDMKSSEDFRIDQIQSNGDIRIETSKSVLAAANGGVKGNNLEIKVGGSIGSEAAKLNAEMSGNVTLNAGTDIYYNERGAIRVNSITAGQTADLTAGSDIVMAGGQGVQASVIALSAGGAIGAGTPLQVQSSSISAKAGSQINLVSGAAMQITQMQAPGSITLRAAQITGNNITTGTLDMTASGNIGSQGALLGTNVSVLRATAGGFAGIRNSGSLAIEKLDAANAVIEASRVTTRAAVNADSLELHAAGGIGDGIGSEFQANVNSFTGTADAGSIFFKNGRSMSVSAVRAAGMVYLAAAGMLTGGDNAVTSDKFVFDVQGLDIGVNVNAAEGISTQGVKLRNSRTLTVGNASDAYHGIKAQGETMIQADGDFNADENIETAAVLQLIAAGGLGISDGVRVYGASALRFQAGGSMLLAAQSLAETSGNADLVITGSGNTTMQVLGTVKAARTNISGAKSTRAVVRSSMGNVKLTGAGSSSDIYVQLLSLDGALDIQGSGQNDSITVDAENKGGKVNISGNGGTHTYMLNLKNSGSAQYQVNGNGTLQVGTTDRNEIIRVDGSGITVDNQSIKVSGIGNMVLNNPGGNNRYDFYDTPCAMTVNSGNGSDVYYIGKLNAGYDGTKTTEGILTRGNSHELSIQDNGGNNVYTIYSAKAPLTIQGGSGNDTFVVKAFVEMLSDGTLVPYENAHMTLRGGSGSNNVEVIKSALFDRIKNKDGQISGSGLDIDCSDMETIKISKYRPGEGASAVWTTAMWVSYSIKQLAESGMIYVLLLTLALLIIGSVVLVKRRKRQIIA